MSSSSSSLEEEDIEEMTTEMADITIADDVTDVPSSVKEEGDSEVSEPSIPLAAAGVDVDLYNPDTDFPMSRREAAVEAAKFMPPQSRVTGHFPGTKKTGRECKLQTNHFTVKLKFPTGVIYQYVVTVKPPWYGKRDYKRTDKQLYHDAIKEWKQQHPVARDNTAAWVFDGHKQLFCTKAYSPAEIPDLRVKVWLTDEGRDIEVDIKDVQLVGSIKVSKELLEWATSGRSGEIPQDALQALDVVLKEAVNLDPNIYNIGRNYFHMDGQTLDLGFGKEVWIGNFSCVRPYGWKDHEILVTLNVDTAHKPAARNLHLTNETGPGKADSYTHAVLTGDGRRKVNFNFQRGLSDEQVKTLEKDLKDLKVKYALVVDGETKMKRNYKVNGLRKAPSKEVIVDLGITVQEYFQKQYGVVLRFPNMPCLWVGPKQKTIYVPMEFCSMEKQPMPL